MIGDLCWVLSACHLELQDEAVKQLDAYFLVRGSPGAGDILGAYEELLWIEPPENSCSNMKKIILRNRG